MRALRLAFAGTRRYVRRSEFPRQNYFARRCNPRYLTTRALCIYISEALALWPLQTFHGSKWAGHKIGFSSLPHQTSSSVMGQIRQAIFQKISSITALGEG